MWHETYLVKTAINRGMQRPELGILGGLGELLAAPLSLLSTKATRMRKSLDATRGLQWQRKQMSKLQPGEGETLGEAIHLKRKDPSTWMVTPHRASAPKGVKRQDALLEDKLPVSSTTYDVPWYDLPASVRRQHIEQGTREITLKNLANLKDPRFAPKAVDYMRRLGGIGAGAGGLGAGYMLWPEGE